MILGCFSTSDEKVNLCLYPCGSDAGPGDRDIYRQEPLRTYKADYIMLLLPCLESEFPEFGACRGWNNRIPAGIQSATIQKIEADMSHIHFGDTASDSCSRFAGWVADVLDQEDMIIAEGDQQPGRIEIILFLLTLLRYLYVPDNSHGPLFPAGIPVATSPISRTAPSFIACFTPLQAFWLPMKAAAVKCDVQHPAYGFYIF